MHPTKRLLASVLLLLSLTGLGAQDYMKPRCRRETGRREIVYEDFAILYDRQAKAPLWTAWHLDTGKLRTRDAYGAPVPGRDPQVKRQSWPQDYDRSEFTAVPMCPPEDMRHNAKAFLQTGYLTTAAPMTRAARQKWLALESLCRRWTSLHGEVWICCGPLYERSLGSIKGERTVMPIPSGFYKAVLRRKDGGWSALGFVIRNDDYWLNEQDVVLSLIGNTVPLSDIEARTGFTLFPQAGDLDRRRIPITEWRFR